VKRTVVIVFSFLFIFVFLSTSSYASPLTVSPRAKAYQMFLLGTILEADGDIKTALQLYNQVLELDPKASPEVYYRIANIYIVLGKSESAEKILKKVIQKFPDELGAYLWLLRLLLQEGKLEEADSYYESLLKKAIELSPDKGKELCKYLGEYYLKKGEHQKAMKYLKEAISSETEDPRPYFLLGALYYQKGDIQTGISYMKKAIQKNPDYDLALNFLGYAYIELGKDLDKAEKLLKRAIEINPNEPAYLDSLGWLYVKKGDLNKAEQYLKQAAIKEDPEIYYHLGILYMKKGQNDKAKSYLGLALAWAEDGSKIKERILEALKEIEAGSSTKEGKEKAKTSKTRMENVPSH